MTTYCIIPARGGSTRIPHKNRRLFHGKPIIAYSIETARDSGLFDRIIVSTDDRDIAEIAVAYGAEVEKRSEEMARNEVGTQEVVRDALLAIEAEPNDYVCCVYATAPLMSAADLERGFEELGTGNYYFTFSVGTQPLCDAAQFYWGDADAFLSREPLIGPLTAMIPIVPERVCDINIESDWFRAEEMCLALQGGNV